MGEHRQERILHFPTETGGNPWGLSRAERRLGAQSDVVTIHPPLLAHPVDRTLTAPSTGKIGNVLRQLAFAAAAGVQYDVLHLNFGRSLLPGYLAHGLDTALLRALGRRVFMTFMGSDARTSTRADGRPALVDDGSGDPFYRPEDDAGKRAVVRRAQRWCDRVFCVNPDLCALIDGSEFLPYTSVDPSAVAVRTPRSDRGPLRVAHAPTKRRVKGTAAVIDACAKLGDAIKLTLIEGRPHADAVAMYRDADVVVDQLRIGWYGGLAVECMAMAVPVIGFIRDEDLVYVPARMAKQLPIIRADAGSLADVLAGLAADHQQGGARLEEAGTASRAYAERWHDPLPIAERLLQIAADPSRRLWDAKPRND
ncbi:MAG: hypothetical protein AAF235_09930 [Planctomycetota bacterium]